MPPSHYQTIKYLFYLISHMMPVLFIGHGSPENALEDNLFTRSWKKIAANIPKPKAILCISAHWMIEGTAITAMERPKTIHDFYGFPKSLYQIRYLAKGSPSLALQINKRIKSVKVNTDQEWGLDHGTWAVLKQMYPLADIPVLQLSLDYQLPLQKAFEIGRELKILREQGILIIGSGNVVHNLIVVNPLSAPYNWAIQFDAFVKNNLIKLDYQKLINYTPHPFAALAHPTNDHYLHLLYVLGAAENETPNFFCEEIVYGSVSMRCVVYGMKPIEMKKNKNKRN